MPSPVNIPAATLAEFNDTNSSIMTVTDTQDEGTNPPAEDSKDTPELSTIENPSMTPAIISSLSNQHIYQLVQPLITDSSISADSNKDELIRVLNELIGSNKLTPDQFWEKSLKHIPWNALKGQEYADMRLEKVKAMETKTIKPKRPKSQALLPLPARPPHYSKLESVQILSQYKHSSAIMDQMVTQQLVPCSKSQLRQILKLKKQGKEGHLSTPWEKEKISSLKKRVEKPLQLPPLSTPPHYTAAEVMDLLSNLPTPTHPPYFTRSQTADLLLKCQVNEKAMMDKLVEMDLVPVSTRQLSTLMKQVKNREANLVKPWNSKRASAELKKSAPTVKDTKPNKRKASEVDDLDKDGKKKKELEKTLNKDLMAMVKSLDDAELIRHMAVEFERRGYDLGLKLGAMRADNDVELAVQKKKRKSADMKVDDGEANAAKDATEEEANRAPQNNTSHRALPVDILFYPSTNPSQSSFKRWDEMYSQLKSFYNANGHLLVTEKTLSQWMNRQKIQWKDMQRGPNHYMTIDKVLKLHELGFGKLAFEVGNTKSPDGSTAMTDRQIMQVAKKEKVWDERLDELKKFKETHGSTVVPRHVNDHLSKWLYRQRIAIKKFREGNINTHITQAKIDKLEEIGFDTSGESNQVREDQRKRSQAKSDAKWEENFLALVAYKESFGTCDVKEKIGKEGEYKKLAAWVGLQRTKYKKRMNGQVHGRTFELTDEQIKKLASIGFNFQGKRLDFEHRFKQVLEFVKEHGHTRVPVFYAEHDNLGRWAKRMRDGIRMNEPWVDEIHKARLLGIGFDIEARHVFDHPKIKQSIPDDDLVGFEKLTENSN